MKEIGLVGFGSFGQFAARYLKPHFEITAYDKVPDKSAVKKYGIKWGTLEEVASKETVILAIPVQYLEELLLELKKIINPNALVMDVSSVKIKPIKMMLQHLPSTVQIIGTHPLFGPQSGKDSVEGLNMVLCPVRTTKFKSVSTFLAKTLKLNVLERTAETHDKQMAYVQALTHFIGRAVNEMDIPDVEQKTPAYQYLLNIKRNLGQDSMDLFLTIEKENPFAKEVREQFIEELNNLNNFLKEN